MKVRPSSETRKPLLTRLGLRSLGLSTDLFKQDPVILPMFNASLLSHLQLSSEVLFAYLHMQMPPCLGAFSTSPESGRPARSVYWSGFPSRQAPCSCRAFLCRLQTDRPTNRHSSPGPSIIVSLCSCILQPKHGPSCTRHY